MWALPPNYIKIMDEEQMSFMDRVSQRMSPAEEVMEQDTTAQMNEEIENEEPESEEMDMPELYQVVYGEPYDAADPQSEGKMRMMQEAIQGDPRVAAMAKGEPEKFALFMYGRTSAIS